MLCEQCQAKQATVHFAIVFWGSDEPGKHLCESCYREVDEERVKAYNTQSPTPFPVEIENITAAAYLRASDRARANSADAPAFRHITKELRGLAATQERLAFELLEMAWENLRRGEDPVRLIWLGCSFGASVTSSKKPEYIRLLEKIIHVSIDKMCESANPISPQQFGFGLSQAGLALRKLDPQRFTTLVGTLKAQCEGEAKEIRLNVIDYLENGAAGADQFTQTLWRWIERNQL